jgi:integrative and conjugative element protein (TIGR02256 family)
LSNGVIDEMITEAKRVAPEETGGMLLGWDNPERNEVVVTTIIGPGPNAEHAPDAFRPDGDWQQQRLEAQYERSDGRITYLGDWHVHPQGGFRMSRRDRRTMSLTASHTEARCSNPLMGLLARRNDGYRLGVWLWEPTWAPFSYGKVTPLAVRIWKPQAQ